MDSPRPKQVASTLIVDDSEGDVTYAEVILAKTGRFSQVYSASDGAEALALFLDYEKARAEHPGAFPPVVLLLDINMPRLTGLEFLAKLEPILERMTEDEPSVVLMLSSSDTERDRKATQRFACVRDYIVKPITAERAIEIAERFGS